MLPVIAIPVLHSSGAWIASTAASGYLAGTLSGTWVGAFVLGNAGWLSSLGMVSAAGWLGASGAISGMATSTGIAAGSALSAIGLGGFAQSIGLLPATFLGLTPVGWAIAGAATTSVGGVVYIRVKRALKRINLERGKGGLAPIAVSEIWREIRAHELTSKIELLKNAGSGKKNWQLSLDGESVSINDEVFPISKTRFVVEKGGATKFVVLGRLGRIIRTFRVDPRSI